MITPEEIRVGNFIQHDLEVGSNDFSVVKPSCFKKDYYLRSYNAIPLTEEWLFKIGFKQEYELDEYELNGFKVIRINKRYELFNHDFPIVIKHVHQLQNLYFALTREELIIK